LNSVVSTQQEKPNSPTANTAMPCSVGNNWSAESFGGLHSNSDSSIMLLIDRKNLAAVPNVLTGATDQASMSAQPFSASSKVSAGCGSTFASCQNVAEAMLTDLPTEALSPGLSVILAVSNEASNRVKNQAD
jgi:hypothetical protein